MERRGRDSACFITCVIERKRKEKKGRGDVCFSKCVKKVKRKGYFGGVCLMGLDLGYVLKFKIYITYVSVCFLWF